MKTQTCQCCGGSLPCEYVWQFARDNASGECTGSVGTDGRCNALSAEDWRDVYSVQTDGFSTEENQEDSLDAAIKAAFTGEGLGKIVDEGSLYRLFDKYVADGGWCRIEKNGEAVIEIGDCR